MAISLEWRLLKARKARYIQLPMIEMFVSYRLFLIATFVDGFCTGFSFMSWEKHTTSLAWYQILCLLVNPPTHQSSFSIMTSFKRITKWKSLLYMQLLPPKIYLCGCAAKERQNESAFWYNPIIKIAQKDLNFCFSGKPDSGQWSVDFQFWTQSLGCGALNVTTNSQGLTVSQTTCAMNTDATMVIVRFPHQKYSWA